MWTRDCVSICPECGATGRHPLLIDGSYGVPGTVEYAPPVSESDWTLFFVGACGHMWHEPHQDWERMHQETERRLAEFSGVQEWPKVLHG